MSLKLLSVLPFVCAFAMAIPAIASDRSEAERQCREWADSVFRASTDAKAREIARCVAERDPDSPEARAMREATRLEGATRADRDRRAEAERLGRTARQDAEARARCGGAKIPAFGAFDFCDSPQAVERKVAESEAIECAPADDCDRLKLKTGSLSLTAYPKYFEGGLYRIAFYATEHSSDDYDTALRNDWEQLVSFVEEEYGPGSGPASPFPPFFSMDRVHVAYTHHWKLGRKQVHVGVFEGDEIYAAIMVVEDELQKSRKERPD
jgi:hypothetical protein